MLEQNSPQNPLFPLKAIYHCRRRLSQQFASIAVSKPQYDPNGLLLNKKTRALLTVLELVGKNSLIPFLKKNIVPRVSGQAIMEVLRDCGVRCMESAEDVMSIIDWLVFTAYTLGLNKRLPLLERLLSFADVYDEQVDQMRDASYSVEGYLLVATFILKAIKILFTIFMESYHKRSPKPPQTPPNMHKEIVPLSICKICCGDKKNKSSTPCGHLFCWSCIIQALECKPQCPVCSSPCEPRSVIQLRNY